MQQGGFRLLNTHAYESNKPVLSVITVVYNSEAFLERTIKSVQAQGYANIEHILVDGGSADATLDIIKRYESKIAYWISEKDNGIYDAMNKGQALASGDYLLFLNSGDEFFETDTVQKIFENFPPADVYYGDTQMIDTQGNAMGQRRLRPPQRLHWKSLSKGMLVCHQSLIVKRGLADPYNTEYRIAADIDWVINALKKTDSICNTHLHISKFMEGGMSSTQMKKGLSERYLILKKHFGFVANLINHTYFAFRLLLHMAKRSR